MTTATTTRTTTQRHPRPAASAQHPRPTIVTRHGAPMPRSTTRVIWTRSSGTMVHYGDIA